MQACIDGKSELERGGLDKRRSSSVSRIRMPHKTDERSTLKGQTKIIWTGNASGLPSRADRLENFHHGCFIQHKWANVSIPGPVRRLGSRFADGVFDDQGDSAIELHHSLATAMLLEQERSKMIGDRGLGPCAIEYCTMNSVESSLKRTISSAPPMLSHILLLFCWTDDPDVSRVKGLYKKLKHLSNRTRIAVHFYPKLEELRIAERKTHDIKALDYIASIAPQEYSFRPKTCVGASKCELPTGMDFVVKRSHSSCSTHVRLSPNTESVSKLQCRHRGRKEIRHQDQDDISDAKVWFHQQKIPSLIDFGEFRVFVVTQGQRGSQPTVVQTFLTKDLGEEDLKVKALDSGYILDSYFCGDRTLQDLHNFALYTFNALRSYPVEHTLESQFDSLCIGARLDIGISSADTGHRFFVNEITREWAGDYFSHYCHPYTKICSAIAKARHRHFFSSENDRDETLQGLVSEHGWEERLSDKWRKLNINV